MKRVALLLMMLGGCRVGTTPTQASPPTPTTVSPTEGPAKAPAQPVVDEPQLGSAGCGAQPGAIVSGAIVSDGVERTYKIELPTDYDPSRPYPVAIAIHGVTGSGATATRAFRLSAQFEGNVIALHPDGILLNSRGMSDWSPKEGGGDLEFIMAMLQAAKDQLCVDEEAVYAVGYSRGGQMVNALACQYPGVFAGIGSISGSPPGFECREPIAALLAHGREDPAVPFEGSKAMAEMWAERSGCSATTHPVEPDGCVAYEGCDPKAPVVWCPHPGGHKLYGYYSDAALKLFREVAEAAGRAR